MFLDAVFTSQRATALKAFQSLKKFEQQEIAEVFGPYWETLSTDESMAKFLLNNWTE